MNEFEIIYDCGDQNDLSEKFVGGWDALEEHIQFMKNKGYTNLRTVGVDD